MVAWLMHNSGTNIGGLGVVVSLWAEYTMRSSQRVSACSVRREVVVNIFIPPTRFSENADVLLIKLNSQDSTQHEVISG